MSNNIVVKQTEFELDHPLPVIPKLPEKIETADDKKLVSDTFALCAQTITNIEKLRKEKVAPLNNARNALMEAARNLQQPYTTAKSAANRLLLIHAQTERKREAERKAVEAREKREAAEKAALLAKQAAEAAKSVEGERIGSETRETPPPAFHFQPNDFKLESEKVKVVTKTDWEVINFSNVPDYCKQINSTEVNARVRAGVREIPGIRIFDVDVVIKQRGA